MPKKEYSSKKTKYSDSDSESEIEIPVIKKNKKFSKKVKYYESESESSESEIEFELENEDINKKLSKQIVKNDDETDISNIIFERINDEYFWGKYGDFEVIMDSDRYINVTKLCSEAKTKNGKKKEFKHWKTTSEAKELIDEISSVVGIPTAEIFKIITTGSKHFTEIRGTYAHPQLVPHIASWASAKFGARVSVIVNEYFAKEMFEKHRNVIKKKDDKIDRLSKKIDKQSKTMKKQDLKIKKLLEQGNEVLGYAKDTNRKINVVVNERVPLSEEPKNEESFYIVRNNDKLSKKRETYDYKAIRITNKSKSTTMSKYYRNHPNGEIILKIKYTPNAKHLWNACKEKIYIKDENIVKYNYCKAVTIFNLPLADKEPGNNAFCYFNLCGDYSERQLKRDIMKIHNKRLKTEDI
ncbi:putative KilA-N domain-containing protein [Moumouvirus australiensis]|uniref:Putative KilA-N domain-containing protein n=1 Tax=Moumouvirus australiensis TaxID=2109587 RepID=A0A2P1EN13_9VIRU|nr:putative KilA-N domain-containing protein [Moumouvirus australiensis]AVL95262.1 putative KilA-N domain-containing protein [Moumouvirus australiensis]